MNRTVVLILHGLGIWAIPFALGFLMYPLRQSMPALFDAAMAVSLTVSAILFAALYLKRFGSASLGKDIQRGLIWLIVCLVVDVALFVLVFNWNLPQYLADIGVTYLIVPVAVVGLGYAARLQRAAR